MKILYISNQGFNESKPGNPVIHNLIISLRNNSKVKDIDFIKFNFTISCLRKIIISKNNYNIIHVHFGGFYAFLVGFLLSKSTAKRIITFHGTDIHGTISKKNGNTSLKIKAKLNRIFSLFSCFLFDKIGFVSKTLQNFCRIKKESHFIQNLGVNYNSFKELNKIEAKKKLKLNVNHKYLLFSSISSNPVKRYDLAEAILVNLPSNFKIITMSNITYSDVPLYISACDALIITSDSEGSPNIVRECLALNRPIFSYDVGNVRKYIELTKNSKIIPKDTQKAASIIQYQINNPIIENTRISLRHLLSNELLLSELISIYE